MRHWSLLFGMPFSRSKFQHQPTLEIVWLLFSTTWVVYALDRIFESEVSLTRSRHQFHRRYRTLFLSLVTIVMLLNCLIIWWLPLPIALYKGGILLGAASAAYILQPHLNISPHHKGVDQKPVGDVCLCIRRDSAGLGSSST